MDDSNAAADSCLIKTQVHMLVIDITDHESGRNTKVLCGALPCSKSTGWTVRCTVTSESNIIQRSQVRLKGLLGSPYSLACTWTIPIIPGKL
jgi:hypothetical protein